MLCEDLQGRHLEYKKRSVAQDVAELEGHINQLFDGDLREGAVDEGGRFLRRNKATTLADMTIKQFGINSEKEAFKQIATQITGRNIANPLATSIPCVGPVASGLKAAKKARCPLSDKLGCLA